MDELQQYEAMENEGVRKAGINLSNIYTVRQGGFGIEQGIQTYLSTLTVDELQNDVSFYETLSKDKGWPVSHIIQREVDQDRVNAIVKKYLLGKGRMVKYFPPIIIALLPKDAEGNFSSSFRFTPDISEITRQLIFDKSKYRDNDSFKKIFFTKQNLSVVDGLYLFNTSTIFEHNVLCWDLSKFFAVVIDGQHRLDALVQAKNENPDMTQALQDVIFIDVSKLIQVKTELTPIEVLRTIFIDINTNAKSVGLVRRILMDDKDLASLCVQSLVESITKEGYTKEDSKFIPSILVDWDGHSLKHELPYITGVLTLYQTLNDELVSDRLVSINDHRDLKKIQYFVSLLNDIFFVDSTIKANGDKADITTLEQSFKYYLKEKEATREVFAEELQEEVIDSILFNYDYRVLEVAQENFEKYFLEPIISIFTKLNPYTKIAESIRELNGFSPESNLYRALLLSRSKTFANPNTKEAYLEAREKLIEELHPQYYLLLTVVGQKAIFKCLFERLWTNFKHGVTPQTISQVFDDFIKQFNHALNLFESHKFNLFGKEEVEISTEAETLIEYGTIYTSFWEGILFEDKRIIYNSQGVRAFADVINFVLSCIEETPSIQKKGLEDKHIRFAEARIKRLLKKRFNRTEEEYNANASLILLNKKQYLIDRINSMILSKED